MGDSRLRIPDIWLQSPSEQNPLERALHMALSNSYWTPPTQQASTYKPWTYAQLIAEYDALAQESNGYMTKTRYEVDSTPVLTKNGSHELYSYTLEPSNYEKTIFIMAGIHGNEMDAKQQLLRLAEILVNEYADDGYTVFGYAREKVKFIIVPCASPYGHEVATMNVPYVYESAPVANGINLNRNFDAYWQWMTDSPGVSGRPPMSEPEVMHIDHLLQTEGLENINYAMDWHDGGDVMLHYWVNYSVDSKSYLIVTKLVQYLIRKYKITNPVIPYVKDSFNSGVAAKYFCKTLGIPASTVEWIGGYLGYTFNASQMTQSLELRGNMVLKVCADTFEGWRIGETPNQPYFKFDYSKAFSREGLRVDGTQTENIVTLANVYSRWDALQVANATLIAKSAQLGTDTYGTQPIYTYTFGNGANKVLYVGGIKRYGGKIKIDEFAIYQLIEYLCNDHIVNQSALLQELRDNYTIIVLPGIDDKAENDIYIRDAGINNMALSYKKWQITNEICEPTSYALGIHDVPIVLSLITDDLKCIVSGGEILTGYALNSTEYATDYETHIVVPKNQPDTDLVPYTEYLESTRRENVVVEHTVGTTFGDYAYDHYEIPTYYVQLKASKRFTELAAYHTLTEEQYLHSNYEAGRRMANIVNLFLMGSVENLFSLIDGDGFTLLDGDSNYLKVRG